MCRARRVFGCQLTLIDRLTNVRKIARERQFEKITNPDCVSSSSNLVMQQGLGELRRDFVIVIFYPPTTMHGPHLRFDCSQKKSDDSVRQKVCCFFTNKTNQPLENMFSLPTRTGPLPNKVAVWANLSSKLPTHFLTVETAPVKCKDEHNYTAHSTALMDIHSNGEFLNVFFQTKYGRVSSQWDWVHQKL